MHISSKGADRQCHCSMPKVCLLVCTSSPGVFWGTTENVDFCLISPCYSNGRINEKKKSPLISLPSPLSPYLVLLSFCHLFLSDTLGSLLHHCKWPMCYQLAKEQMAMCRKSHHLSPLSSFTDHSGNLLGQCRLNISAVQVIENNVKVPNW